MDSNDDGGRRNLSNAGFLLLMLVVVPLIGACDIYRDIQNGKIQNYEVGQQAQAKACKECHEEIYEEWSNNSAHAIATVNKPFLDFKEKFTDVSMYDAMMGEGMCYACHGSKAVNEGVNCETCHGLALADDEEFEKTHEVKYGPGMEKMRNRDFCAKCHTMKSPFTGDLILSLYDEWENSKSGKDGVTCQECHMKPRDHEEAYHGFDSLSRNVGIYREILEIRDIQLEFPQLNLTVVNKVSGHAIPASGPSRIMVMELFFRDAQGSEIYQGEETFGKYYDLMPVLGIMPYALIRNTQLQSDEIRKINFTLPAKLRGNIAEVRIIMRFYDVSDDFQGDIKKAHTISKPFLIRVVDLQ